jgi:hypothetical protein
MRTTAEFRCAVRPAGQEFMDKELDREENVMPTDPHVCLLGYGPTMQVFYTSEKSDGVHLLYSSDAGQTFQAVAGANIPGAFMPSVHGRMQGGQVRVDMLYCSPNALGLELHNLQWDNFSVGTVPRVYHLTETVLTPGGTPPAGCPQGYLITTLAWFGYDAVLVGDDLAVVTHEMTYDMYEYYWTGGFGAPAGVPSAGTTSGSSPVLLPGMTGSVPAPDPAHRNQLRVAVLD